jgi:anti-anti-sigma factor
MVPLLNAALVPAPDQVVVRLKGDADLSTAPLVVDALTQAAGLGTRQVVVDVAGTRFWDCSGLHALARFTRELSAAGRACRIVGALPATRRLISMANLADGLQLDGVPAGPARRPTAAAGMPARRRRSGRAAPVTADLVVAGHGR